MRAELLLEALRMARARRLQTSMTVLLAATTCTVILAATVNSLQAERRVLGLIDDVGTRQLVITDIDGGAALSPRAVARIGALEGVETVVGFSRATDGSNPYLRTAGQRVPVRRWYGDLPDVLDASRTNGLPGTALATEAALVHAGVQPPGGVLELVESRRTVAIVGGFEPDEPFEFLDGSVLVRGMETEDAPVVREIRVLATAPRWVGPLQQVLGELAAPARPESLAVTADDDLARLRAAVEGEIGGFGRRVLVLVLAVTLFLVALTSYSTVMTRRRDFGRRRALGASRSDVLALVVFGTAVPAAVGVTGGLMLGAAISWRAVGTPPDLRFALAVGVLTVLVSTAASLAPAAIVALRDPLRELRVP